MMWIRLLPYAGWPLAAFLFVLWLNAKEAIVEEREGCNVAQLEAALESERLARSEMARIHANEIQAMAALLERERRASEIAREAAELAESRTERVRTVIKKVADEDACIDTVVPVELTDSLRRRTGSS